MSLIGENMRRIREINNLTQKQVSEKMFIDRSIYSKYESGKLIPSEERIKIFANIFNCNLEELKKNNSAIIPDTSALMQNQNLLSLLIEDYKLIIIPTTVIFELDHLKNTSKKKKIASQVMHSILAYKEQTEKIIFEESSFPAINNDSKIIKCAEMSKKKYHMDVFIIHNDIGFCLNYPNNIILKDYIAQRTQGIYANIIKLDELQENFEVTKLREYSIKNNKNFYAIDSGSLSLQVEFMNSIINGFSYVPFAKEVADEIYSSYKERIILTDGDKTLTMNDSSSVLLNYKTNIFDNNLYSGFQFWLQEKELSNLDLVNLDYNKIKFNEYLLQKMNKNTIILTCGHPQIWEKLSQKLGFKCFSGINMNFDTKTLITKFLREKGVNIIAYGDSFCDIGMLSLANEGNLIIGQNPSRSLTNINISNFKLIRR